MVAKLMLLVRSNSLLMLDPMIHPLEQAGDGTAGDVEATNIAHRDGK